MGGRFGAVKTFRGLESFAEKNVEGEHFCREKTSLFTVKARDLQN